MKLRAVIEIPLLPNVWQPKGSSRDLKQDRRELEGKLPVGVLVKSVQHVTDKTDMRAAFKRLLSWHTESTPLPFLPKHRRASGAMAGDEKAPFVSETFLYPLLGKDDARTLLYKLREVMRVAGVDMDDLEREVVAEQRVALEAAAKLSAVQEGRRKFWHQYAKGKGWDADELTSAQSREIRVARRAAGIP